MNILALNVGSSSLKFRLFQITPDAEKVLTEGTVERLDANALLPAAQKAIEQCRPFGIDAVGHRVVQGGARFFEPTRVTPDVLQDLRGLQELDPLHNPTEVALIEAAQKLLPDVPAVAVFDTAFHRTLPEVAWRYALPSDLSDRLGLRRYGFHGISHRYVSGRLLECLGREAAGDAAHHLPPGQRGQRLRRAGRPKRGHQHGPDASGGTGHGNALGRRGPRPAAVPAADAGHDGGAA